MLPAISHSVTSAMTSPETFASRARRVAVHSPERNASAIITPYQRMGSEPK